jgi:Tfp pilus assembly protein PilF
LTRPLRISILAVLVLLAAAGVVVVMRTRGDKQRAGTLDALLTAADAAQAAGQPQTAEEALSGAMGLAKDAGSRLMVLKRFYSLCRSRGDFAPLAVWAARARKSAPRDPALTRLALYAALRSGRDELAAELLADRRVRRLLRSQPDLQYLAAEAVLRGQPGSPEIALPPELEALVSLQPGVHPSLLIEQGRASGDDRYYLDAALLWMKRGQAKNALAILNSHLKDAYHEPAAYISYDAGATAEAARRAALLVRRQPDNAEYRRFYGDILFQERRYDRARDMYLRALRLEADASWQTTLNLAAALEYGGDPDSARFYTARAFADFPDKKEVLIRYARSLAREGQQQRAADLLGGYLQRHPEEEKDPEIKLLHLRMGGGLATPGQYRAELWKLHNRFPGDMRTAQALTDYLLSFADLDAAALVINQYAAAQAESEDHPWLPEARAAIAALRGDYAEAEASLLAKLRAEDSWESRYNLAVILGADARYAEGVSELMTAESLVSGSRSAEYRSKIRGKLGEFYAALGDISSARRELVYALELDPGNLHPRLVLKKLDEVHKK